MEGDRKRESLALNYHLSLLNTLMYIVHRYVCVLPDACQARRKKAKEWKKASAQWFVCDIWKGYCLHGVHWQGIGIQASAKVNCTPGACKIKVVRNSGGTVGRAFWVPPAKQCMPPTKQCMEVGGWNLQDQLSFSEYNPGYIMVFGRYVGGCASHGGLASGPKDAFRVERDTSLVHQNSFKQLALGSLFGPTHQTQGDLCLLGRAREQAPG